MASDNKWPGDWRLVARSQIAHDLPEAYPGGPSHKAGDLVTLTSLVQAADGKRYAFSIPSSAALALNLSIAASDRAAALKNAVRWTELSSPDGATFYADSTGTLFDLLEQYMAAATFAFNALEAYANYAISFHLKGTLNLAHRGKASDLSAVEIEKRLSTDEKIGQVLPLVLKVRSPKGTKLWERFSLLKSVRDTTVHLKHSDQTGDGSETLFYRYLREEPRTYANIAVDVVSHFDTHWRSPWLDDIKRKLGR